MVARKDASLEAHGKVARIVDTDSPLALGVSGRYRGVACLGLIPTLFDCGTINWQKGVEIVNDITAGVLEETLHCQNRAADITAIKSRHPEIGEFVEAR